MGVGRNDRLCGGGGYFLRFGGLIAGRFLDLRRSFPCDVLDDLANALDDLAAQPLELAAKSLGLRLGRGSALDLLFDVALGLTGLRERLVKRRLGPLELGLQTLSFLGRALEILLERLDLLDSALLGFLGRRSNPLIELIA